MILFAGTIEKGFFAEDVCNVDGIRFKYIKASSSIKNQIQEILENSECDYIIYDIAQYVDTTTDIVDFIVKIRKSTKSKPIIFSPGYDKNSNVIVALRENGVRAFIFSNIVSEKKENLRYFISHYAECSIEDENTEEFEEEILKATIHKRKEITSIALTGAIERIGTTTQAIQIAKLYLLFGYKPCYIQLDNSGFVERMGVDYDNSIVDEESCRVTCEGVDMYYNPEKIDLIRELDYDCYIYDYGVYSNPSFNRISFIEKDLKIVVCGIKNRELLATTKLMESVFYKDLHYVFSFTAEGEQENVLKLMYEYGKNALFAGYSPDPFIYYPVSSMYQKICKVEEKETTEKKKKKFSFFRRR